MKKRLLTAVAILGFCLLAGCSSSPKVDDVMTQSTPTKATEKKENDNSSNDNKNNEPTGKSESSKDNVEVEATVGPTATCTPTPVLATQEDLFEYKVGRNAVCITGIKDKTLEKIIIPTTIDGKDVYKIGDFVFTDCENLISVEIPGSISISEYAFYGCKQLQTVIVNGGVFLIPEYAFYGCTNLISIEAEEVYLKDGGNYAFYGCINLKDISLGTNSGLYGYPEIGYSTFYGCTSLESIIVPSGITDISKMAFAGCSSLRRVELPEGLCYISDDAFSGCGSLKSLKLPTTMECVGHWSREEAFLTGTNLDRIEIPYGVTVGEYFRLNSQPVVVTSEGSEAESWAKENGYTIAYGTLESVGEISNNDSVVEEGENSDDYLVIDIVSRMGTYGGWVSAGLCYPMPENIIIPQSVGETKVVGIDGFQYSDIKNITLSEGIEYVMDRSFDGCTNLESINLPETLQAQLCDQVFFGCVKLRSIKIPENVILFRGEEVFSHCTSLNDVILLQNAQVLGKECFYMCSNLESIIIPDTVYKIGERAFGFCVNLKSITLPQELREISEEAFTYCVGLETVILPENLEKIGIGAFYNCRNLENVIIPNSVTYIGYGAYAYCNNLTSVVISNSVESIYDSTFLGCSSLTCVTIPNSVTSIADNAFENCPSLITIYTPAGSYAETWAKENGYTVVSE